jgi:hypothetical protein
VGKNIAALLFVYLEAVVLCAIALAMGFAAGWWKVAESLVVVGICSLYMLGIGNFSSVNFPRALTPERVSQSRSGGRVQGLIFLVYPLTLLPVFLAYLARYALRSELAFVLMLGLAAIIGGVVYRLALDSSVNALSRRREQILQALVEGEGPVAAD